MPKLRLGVALLVPPPLDREVDAFRRATGDGTYGRVPAHLTLVPPVNVRADRFDEALAVLRLAATATGPHVLDLGPPATFMPDNPVLYLPVAGQACQQWLAGLRQRVFVAPLARPLAWPFVAHVTLADEADPQRISAAQVALSGYSAEMAADRLHLLQEGPGRVWAPVADFGFGPPAVIGRGGLPVELVVTERLDPEGEGFARREWAAHDRDALGREVESDQFAVTARRDGRVVAVARATTRDQVARLSALIVDRSARHQGIGSHVLAAFESEAACRGHCRLSLTVRAGSEAEAFYRERGWVAEFHRADWYGGLDYLEMRRDLGRVAPTRSEGRSGPAPSLAIATSRRPARTPSTTWGPP